MIIKLTWRVASVNCYKVTKTGLAFTNEIYPLWIYLKLFLILFLSFVNCKINLFQQLFFSAYLITVLLNLEVIFNCLI